MEKVVWWEWEGVEVIEEILGAEHSRKREQLEQRPSGIRCMPGVFRSIGRSESWS